jgi:hypothetical protein
MGTPLPLFHLEETRLKSAEGNQVGRSLGNAQGAVPMRSTHRIFGFPDRPDCATVAVALPRWISLRKGHDDDYPPGWC